MAGINIPGVTDKYKTNDTVEKLMQIERIPLTREQQNLDGYKEQQDAWRSVNKKMTSLRESVKSLYSFDNPFGNKITESSQEHAVSATASRGAKYETFKVDVVQTAESDRFLTSELDADTKVPAGTYTYKVNDKTVSMRWKGGSLSEFSDALNRRGNGIISSRVIGASRGKKTLSIESLKTGEENRLSFEADAKTFAETSGMIIKAKPKSSEINLSRQNLRTPQKTGDSEQARLPEITAEKITVSQGKAKVPPRSGFTVNLPDDIQGMPNIHLTFAIEKQDVADITEELNRTDSSPVFPETGSATFRDVTIINSPVDAALPDGPKVALPPVDEIQSNKVVFAVDKNGNETEIPTSSILTSDRTEIDIKLDDYDGITAITIRNRNTGKAFEVSEMQAFNPSENLGFIPQHPVSQAQDAVIRYEGITIKRSANEIDDVVPDVTLNIHEKTERSATISVKPDTESAKDALITFVGKYNQALSEVNVLTQRKQEIIDELDYLSEEEREDFQKKLGIFSADSSLSSLKSKLQSITQAHYPSADYAEITMLNQIGIATNATSYSGYSPSRLRGYLEIDEKKLDEVLEKNLDEVKNLFGYDSDGDLIVDSGIAFNLDTQLTAYVQTGGIFSMKTSSLDGKIKSSEQKITRLESQMEQKEADLRNKYGQMEGALNSLENQQNTISNFSNRNNNNR